MSIETYTPEVTLSGWAAVERECSHCKNTWTEKIKIKAIGRGDSSLFIPGSEEFNRAKEKAQQQYKGEEEGAKKQVNKGVLCPLCNHLSTGAIAKFFPNGYLAGIKKKLNQSLLISFLIFPPCGFVMGLLIWVFLFSERKGGSEEIWGMITVAVLLLAFAAGFIYNARIGMRLVFGYKRVDKFLQTKKENELLDIVVSQYQKNKNSLAGNYKWAEMLLKRTKPK